MYRTTLLISLWGGSQNNVISLTPTAPFPITEIQFSFACVGEQAAVLSGLNTFELSASSEAVLDIVALSATASENGIVDIDGSPPTGSFLVATVNLGASGSIYVGSEFLGNLPMALSVFETDADLGICLNTPAANLVTEIDAGATPTFAVFLQAGAKIPLDPVKNWVRVEFRDSENVLRGSTSVAARSQETAADSIAVVTPTIETSAWPASGDAADDVAIWIHPDDPGSSPMLLN